MTETFHISPLLIIIVLAFFVPILITKFKRFRIPVVVGEILAGIVVGKSGLDLIHSGPWLEFLNEFGLTFLLFLSGLEINVDLIRRFSPQEGKSQRLLENPLYMGAIIFFLTLLASLLVSFGLVAGGLIQSPWLMTLILSTTSLAVVMPVLKERHLSETLYGQTLLVATLVADFGTMLLITVAVAILSGGLSLDILLILVLFAAFFLFYRFGLILKRQNFVEELRHATTQIQVRGAFMFIVVFVALAQQLGVEVILGSFLAGLMISLLSERGSSLYHKMDAIGYGFFVPIFFVMVGANFDLRALFASRQALLLVPVLLLAAYALKMLPSLLLQARFSLRETLAGGVLLSSRLSMIIAASAIGLSIGAVTEAVNAAIILVAIVSCTISPILFERILPSEIVKRRSGIVILGAARFALTLAERLRTHQGEMTIIDSDERKVAEARAAGWNALRGDGTSKQDLREAGAGSAEIFLAITGNDELNLQAAEIVRKEFEIEHVIPIIGDPILLQEAATRGFRAVNPDVATMTVIDNLVRHPASFALLTEDRLDDDGLVIEDFCVSNPTLDDIPVRNLPLPTDTSLIAIFRGSEKLYPHGDTAIFAGDLLSVVTTRESLEDLQSLFNCPGGARNHR